MIHHGGKLDIAPAQCFAALWCYMCSQSIVIVAVGEGGITIKHIFV